MNRGAWAAPKRMMKSLLAGKFNEPHISLSIFSFFLSVPKYSFLLNDFVSIFLFRYINPHSKNSDKEDKLDLINPTTPSTTVLPSASLGVASINLDSCSESEPEIKLEKVNIIQEKT